MEKIRIKNLEEDVYYEKLDNGLEVYLYTKDDIYTNYVTFTTKYGSVYNEFKYNNKMKKVPNGIAHFLEHSLIAIKQVIVQQIFQAFLSRYMILIEWRELIFNE